MTDFFQTRPGKMAVKGSMIFCWGTAWNIASRQAHDLENKYSDDSSTTNLFFEAFIEEFWEDMDFIMSLWGTKYEYQTCIIGRVALERLIYLVWLINQEDNQRMDFMQEEIFTYITKIYNLAKKMNNEAQVAELQQAFADFETKFGVTKSIDSQKENGVKRLTDMLEALKKSQLIFNFSDPEFIHLSYKNWSSGVHSRLIYEVSKRNRIEDKESLFEPQIIFRLMGEMLRLTDVFLYGSEKDETKKVIEAIEKNICILRKDKNLAKQS